MTRIPIASSMMVSVGYDAEHSILEIEFRSGEIYEYRDVPELVYRRFLKAPSRGRFFHAEIDHKYRFIQVDFARDAEKSDENSDGIPGWPQLE